MGAAHRAPANTDGFFGSARAVGEGVHLALAHASERSWLTAQESGKQPHAPFDAAEIEAAGFAHAFLGHFHVPKDAERHTYPGNPDPLEFGETGERGECPRHRRAGRPVQRERRVVAVSQVHDVEVALDGCEHADDVRDRVTAVVGGLRGSVRVDLTGTVAPVVRVDGADLSALGGHLDGLVIRRDRVTVGYDLGGHRRGGHCARGSSCGPRSRSPIPNAAAASSSSACGPSRTAPTSRSPDRCGSSGSPHALRRAARPEPRARAGLNVIFGPNEAGKTTWHAAIRMALTGVRRGRGSSTKEASALEDRHRPWDDPDRWAVEARVHVGDRRIDLVQDLLGKVACRATDVDLGIDVSAEITRPDGTPDASIWLGLDRDAFASTLAVGQGEMLAVADSADALQEHMQRAAAAHGTDATAAGAIERLREHRRRAVGADTASPRARCARPCATSPPARRSSPRHAAGTRPTSSSTRRPKRPPMPWRRPNTD